MGKQANVQCEDVHIVGASQQFMVEAEYMCADRINEVAVCYPWIEDDKNFMAVLMNNIVDKKMLENIFGIKRSSIWDDMSRRL